MGCCGKAKNIATGYLKIIIEQVFHKELETPESRRREDICMSDKCGKLTYLKKKDYMEWVVRNGKSIVKNFEDLAKLPELPKVAKHPKKIPFCMTCKCYIPAKVRVNAEICPKGKW